MKQANGTYHFGMVAYRKTLNTETGVEKNV